MTWPPHVPRPLACPCETGRRYIFDALSTACPSIQSLGHDTVPRTKKYCLQKKTRGVVLSTPGDVARDLMHGSSPNSTIVSERASPAKTFKTFSQTVRVGRDKIENRRFFHKYTSIYSSYIDLLRSRLLRRTSSVFSPPSLPFSACNCRR